MANITNNGKAPLTLNVKGREGQATVNPGETKDLDLVNFHHPFVAGAVKGKHLDIAGYEDAKRVQTERESANKEAQAQREADAKARLEGEARARVEAEQAAKAKTAPPKG